MLYLNDIILGFIYILFPLSLYYFYIAYNNMIETKENDLFLCFTLFSSMYLINLQSSFNYPRAAILLSNIPIIIALLKNRWQEAAFLSLFYIVCAGRHFNIYYWIIILEYIMYFILYYIKRKEKFNDYIYITIFFIIKTIIYLLRYNVENYFFDDSIFTENLYLTIPIIYVTTMITYYLFTLGEAIARYHISYKELLKEKQIKTSLFKITHEIKNPLSVCKGYLDMLDVEDKEKVKSYIPIIKNELNHTLYILNDFSSYSKLSISKEDMDICFLLSDVTNSYSALLKKNKIKLVLLNKDEIIIKGDYKRLTQVVINLIKNSIEAFGDKKNKLIRIVVNEDKKRVYIDFEDNGCGISKDGLEKIKEPFYTTKEFGTGLGVSISNEIIVAHGGSINYESQEGIGTKVSIIIQKK